MKPLPDIFAVTCDRTRDCWFAVSASMRPGQAGRTLDRSALHAVDFVADDVSIAPQLPSKPLRLVLRRPLDRRS
jgi:hypothetical protein